MGLLSFLALTSVPHGRDALAELLYPALDRERAYADFRQCLTALRKAIGEERIHADAASVALRPGKGLTVDVIQFRALLRRAQACAHSDNRGAQVAMLTRAVRLYRGRFLSGFSLDDSPEFEQWQAEQEEELRGECSRALDQLVEAHTESNEMDAAIEWARAALKLDPLEEVSHRRLMRLLALAGHRAAALRQYDRCRDMLAGEFDGEPDENTQALLEEIRTGHLAPREIAPSRAPEMPPAPGTGPPVPSGICVFLFAGLSSNVPRLARTAAAQKGTVFGRTDTELRAVFPGAAGAVLSALKMQAGREASRAGRSRPRAMARIALHAGEAEWQGTACVGAAVERAEFLLRAAHPGQVLMSGAAVDLAVHNLPPGASLRPLGTHHLEDLGPPVAVHQLVYPGLPSRFPPVSTLESLPGNLRGQPTFLVGRERELEMVADLLRRDDVRILTLTGPGGTGKTRLALHAAARLARAFPHGAFFVDLAAVTEPDQAVPAIAATLGIREPPGQPRPPSETLAEGLRRRQLLLVLDNFEHIVTAARQIGALSAACPGIKVIVTSREPLHLQREREFAVPPLELLAPDEPARDLARCASVRLFAERAQRVRPDFVLTPDNARVAAEICARIDGLPLAIELIAARVKALPLSSLLQRITQRMELLGRGSDDLPVRQRALRTEIAWSHDLLPEEERRLFRRLAVFPAGCTLGGAEAVCADESRDAVHETLDRLSALVDKSLVLRREVQGHSRYRMLETIRDFAVEKLEASGEAREIGRRFCAHEKAIAEEAAPHLLGPDQDLWFRLLDAEQDNLQAALGALHGAGQAADGVGMAGALGWYWFRRGRFTVAALWLGRFLAADPAVAPPPALSAPAQPAARARALYYCGWMHLMLGSTFYGNDEARDCFRQSLECSQRAGDARGEALCLAWLSWCDVDLPVEERHALAGRAEAVSRATGDAWTIAFCLKLAHSYLPREDETATEKVAALEEAMRLARETGDPFLECQAVHGMGDVYMFLRNDTAAEPWYLDSLRRAREIGDTWSIFDTQSHLGWGYANRGDLARARCVFSEALQAAAACGAMAYVGQYLAGFASLAKMEGRAVRALRLGGAASVLRYDGQPRWDPRLTEGTGLPRGTVELEWSRGSAMTLDASIRFALGDED